MDTSKHSNITITIVPGEERKEGAERIFEKIMAANSPNMRKNIYIYLQEVQQTSGRKTSKRSTPRHIIKLLEAKDKEKIESNTREVTPHMQGIPVRLNSRFLFRNH